MSYGWLALAGISVSRLSSSRSHGSCVGRSGAATRLEAGRKSMKSRAAISASTSSSNALSATDVFVVWVTAPPSASCVTTSFVTVLTTSGPVTNM